MSDDDQSEDTLLAQERVTLQAAELVCEAMERAGLSRAELARRLSITPSEITQRLQGGRNLTLRSLSDMLHALGHQLVLDASWDPQASERAGDPLGNAPDLGTAGRRSGPR